MSQDSRLLVEPFKAEHFHQLSLSPHAATEFGGASFTTESMRLYERCPSYTARDAATMIPLLAAGIFIPWPGLGEAWAIFGRGARRLPVSIFRVIAGGLRQITESAHLRRVQAHVSTSLPEGHRLARHLGFKPESVLKLFGPQGEDHVLYVWFPGDRHAT